jgi:hypothetical protein
VRLQGRSRHHNDVREERKVGIDCCGRNDAGEQHGGSGQHPSGRCVEREVKPRRGHTLGCHFFFFFSFRARSKSLDFERVGMCVGTGFTPPSPPPAWSTYAPVRAASERVSIVQDGQDENRIEAVGVELPVALAKVQHLALAHAHVNDDRQNGVHLRLVCGGAAAINESKWRQEFGKGRG